MRPDPSPDSSLVLAAMIASTSDAVLTITVGGTITSWSPGAERLYGYDAVEIIKADISSLFPADRREQCAKLLADLRSGTRVDRLETTHRARNGAIIGVSLTATPLPGAGAETTAALLVVQDTREQAGHRASEAQWRALIDAAVDGVIVIDAGGAIRTFNPAAQRMFGYAEDEVLGRNVSLLMPSPYRQEHDDYLRRYLRTGERRIIGIGRDVTGLRRSGEAFPLHLSVGEFDVGAERRFVGILHDLSARVELEGRLREQAALARLGEMAAVIAHEVRNPLTAVRGAIQVMGKRLASDSGDAEIVKEIVARLDGLNHLIQDLLLFARTPQPKLAPVDLRGLLALTVDLLQRDPAFRSIELTVSGEAPAISGDGELLKIAIQNVLLNAAQAMQGRGTIRAFIAPLDAGAQVRIVDEGPGMSSAVREQLFRPFFTTKARGTGLGLATVRRVIESHHGTVRFEFPPAGGTEVVIDLPGPG